MSEQRGWIRSPIVGGLIGLFSGGLVILVMESVGHRLFGVAADPTDLSDVTTAMFGSVLVAWVVGSAVGGAVATYWSRASSATVGLVVGLFLLAGAISNMFVIAHPVWMMVGAVVLMPTAAVLSARRWARPSGA